MSALEENPNCARTRASFRLVGDALDPDEVSAELGLAPTWTAAKDQEIPVGRQGRTSRRQSTGVWLLASEDHVDSTAVERHLVHLLDAVEPASAAVDALRRRQELRADFFCYWPSATGHGGPEVSPGTLRRIAALDAALGFDFYKSASGSGSRLATRPAAPTALTYSLPTLQLPAEAC